MLEPQHRFPTATKKTDTTAHHTSITKLREHLLFLNVGIPFRQTHTHTDTQDVTGKLSIHPAHKNGDFLTDFWLRFLYRSPKEAHIN
jgi:hypothetical protein